MGTVALYLVLVMLLASVFVRPWITVIAYYGFVLLSPQYIWFWIFGDLPVSKILTIFILLGVLVSFLKGSVNLKRLSHIQNYFILVLWAIIHLSNLLAPFPEIIVSIPVSLVLSTLNSIIIVYFAAQLLITNEKQLIFLTYVILFVGLYFTYWGNSLYLSGDMWRYSTSGRLGGPVGSVYSDENSFALVFAISMPFILHFGLSRIKKIYKFSFLASIPLLWHALFLTGSRGGLVSTIASLAFSLRSVKSKTLILIIVAGLVVALIDQGGALRNRGQNTLNSQSDSENIFEEDHKPIDPRVLSWTAGLEMLIDYPLLGVGTERFLTAYPYYQDGKIHTTHNTFFQIASNNGIFAGLIYLLLFIYAYKNYKFLKKTNRSKELTWINEASMSALVAFFIGSMFLDLMAMEIFYFLLQLNILKYHIFNEDRFNTAKSGNK